jgi:hypothetical protein
MKFALIIFAYATERRTFDPNICERNMRKVIFELTASTPTYFRLPSFFLLSQHASYIRHAVLPHDAKYKSRGALAKLQQSRFQRESFINVMHNPILFERL